MFLPFCRGDGTWIQRLQAVDYLRKVEFLHQFHQDYAPQENGLNLPISQEIYHHIASADYLRETFGKQYLAPQNRLAAGLKPLYAFCRRHSVTSLQELGPEYDFSIACPVDQYLIADTKLEVLLQPLRLDALPEQAVIWTEIGFMRYKESDFQNSLNHFKKALQAEPALYPLHFRIGLIYLNCPDLVNEGNAFYYFKTCADFALNRNDRKMAGQAYLHASFAAYLLTKDQEAMQLAQKAITLDPAIAESYYLYAKVATLHDSESAFFTMRTAIALHNHYIFKAGADRDLEPILARLTKELFEEAHQKAATPFAEFEDERARLKNIEHSIHDQELRISQVGAHREFFEQINHQFVHLAAIYKRHTFFDFNLFRTKFEAFSHEWLTPSIKDQIGNRYRELQNLTRAYTDLDHHLGQFSVQRNNVKIAAFLSINFAFISLILHLISYPGHSANALVLVPLFTILTAPTAFGQKLLNDIGRFFYFITFRIFTRDRLERLGSVVKVLINRYFYFVYQVINTLILVLALLFLLFSESRHRPRYIFFYILCTYGCLWLYNHRQTHIAALARRRIQLDAEINSLLQNPLPGGARLG